MKYLPEEVKALEIGYDRLEDRIELLEKKLRQFLKEKKEN